MAPAEPGATARGFAAFADLCLRLPRGVRAVAPIAVMVTLWWSSDQVPVPKPYTAVGALMHNGMHVVVYAVLAATIWLAVARRPFSGPQPWRSRAAWLLAGCYAIVDEVHQSHVPGRVCSFADVCSDLSGAALAIVVLRGLAGVTARWSRWAVLFALAGLASVLAATFTGW